ncbi:MAG: hypothetical protein ACI4MI_02490 [Christensenellales bacterium]
MDKKEFNYTYTSLSQAEKKQVENIRKEYDEQAQTPDDLQNLIKMDKLVKNRPTAIAITLGIVGVLIFGTGMSVSMVWEKILIGSIIGAVGVAVCLCTPLIHKSLLRAMKKKYGEKILELSKRLLGEDRTETEENQEIKQ